MDRFIVQFHHKLLQKLTSLKSNMDRFIDGTRKAWKNLKGFKIQYG